MKTKKILMVFGASALALGLTQEGAQARKVSYEIAGKSYTYDSRDPRQVELARKRIDAANALDTAKAKAAQTSNPLAAVFGSAAKSEVNQAEANLQKVMGEEPDETGATGSARHHARTHLASRRTGHGKPAEEQARAAEAAPEKADDATRSATAEQQPQDRTTLPPSPDAAPQEKAKPMVKSVSFDVESGIKTTIMSDGSVEEEPFDSNTLAKLASEHDNTGSLTRFVNTIRKTAPEDTGSTAASGARGAARAPQN